VVDVKHYGHSVTLTPRSEGRSGLTPAPKAARA
jgi:hypothetical protein